MTVPPPTPLVNSGARPCPACRRALRTHPPSRRRRNLPNACALVNGRCYVGGEPARQKLSWVQLGEEMTLSEYQARYAERAPELEPCPG